MENALYYIILFDSLLAAGVATGGAGAKHQQEIVKQGTKVENQDIIELLQGSENQIQRLQNALEVLHRENAGLRVENETWRRVSDSTDTFEMAAVAKILNYKSIGRNKMFDILRELKVLRYNNEPFQEHIDADRFKVIEQEVQAGSYGTMVNRKTVVTQKGIDYIRKVMDKYTSEAADGN